MSITDWIDCVIVFLVFAGTMTLFAGTLWLFLSFLGWLIDNWLD